MDSCASGKSGIDKGLSAGDDGCSTHVPEVVTVPRDSQVMAARLKLKLERELGRESEQWVRDLAATPIYPDWQPRRSPFTAPDPASRRRWWRRLR